MISQKLCEITKKMTNFDAVQYAFQCFSLSTFYELKILFKQYISEQKQSSVLHKIITICVQIFKKSATNLL